MKNTNWKLIIKLIITIATAVLGILSQQDHDVTDERWRANESVSPLAKQLAVWNVYLRFCINILLLAAAIVAILSCSRILWKQRANTQKGWLFLVGCYCCFVWLFSALAICFVLATEEHGRTRTRYTMNEKENVYYNSRCYGQGRGEALTGV